MNLIEQLGGYEKSKRELKLKEEGSVFQCCMSISAEMIRAALLQHRRENNIFEVGDLVTHPIFWGIFEIKEVMSHHVVGVTPTGYESKLAVQLIKHASDKEIKQGYRDDCSHEYNIDLLGGADKCVRCGNIKK